MLSVFSNRKVRQETQRFLIMLQGMDAFAAQKSLRAHAKLAFAHLPFFSFLCASSRPLRLKKSGSQLSSDNICVLAFDPAYSGQGLIMLFLRA